MINVAINGYYSNLIGALEAVIGLLISSYNSIKNSLNELDMIINIIIMINIMIFMIV